MDLKRICLRCMNGEIGPNGICSACGKPQLHEQTPVCALPLETILHGRYLIGGVLGQGGFGITYAAYDLAENRRVVIKELFPGFMVHRTPGTKEVVVSGDPDLFLKSRNRFVEEARLIYTFRASPEIVDVYHIFIENNTGYYTMEYLTGQTLYSFFQANGKIMTWEQLTPIVRDVINALRTVHRSKSIHRDISPDNIYLSSNGRAKLIDFGAARNYNSGRHMTQILKKGFAPWEQYQSNGNFGPWTDIYALGATIYVCMTGRMLPEATARALNDSVLRPSEWGAAVPQYVEDAIMQALSIKPESRFQSVDAFALALRMRQDPVIPGPVRPDPNKPTTQQIGPQNRVTPGEWRLRGIRGQYAGMQFPFSSNIIIGRDPKRCTLVYPPNAPGVSAVHLSLLFGTGPSFPGIRCESTSQVIYINGTMFSGRGRIGKLQSGDRITFGDNQIFTVERVK